MGLVIDDRPVYVIGFMATGKTSVGRRLAERLGRTFVDLDEEIERKVGKSIPTIFHDEGEAQFRRYEAAALGEVSRRTGAVIACGGGTPCFGDNLRTMKSSGLLVALHASVDDLLGRVVVAEERPVWKEAGSRAKIEALYRDREAVYSRADFTVDTTGRDVDNVVDEALARTQRRMGQVTVQLGDRSYPVHLGSVERAGELSRELLGNTTIGIVTDDGVKAAGHLDRLEQALSRAGLATVSVSVPAGEASKSMATLEQTANALVEKGLDRSSALLALGGGVVGDLAGFLAASLFRGMAYAQIPTTLLAMVDSAVGGKTAVNLSRGKNLFGAFWQPRFVLADTSVLSTLPDREATAAFAEIYKVALLTGGTLHAELQEHGRELPLEDAVRACVAYKASIVSGDERESLGEPSPHVPSRLLLNLGHTVGHAIEAASWETDRPLLHGEAIALGLVAAARISARLGAASAELPRQVEATLAKLGLPSALNEWLRPDVLARVGADKKRVGQAVRFVVLKGVGQPRIESIEATRLGALLQS